MAFSSVAFDAEEYDWRNVGDDEKKKAHVMSRKSDLVQAKDPDSGRYVKIDRALGVIVSRKKSMGPYKNISIVSKMPVLKHQRKQQDKTEQENTATSLITMKKSRYASNKCVFHDDIGVWLYQANCLEFMDALIAKYPAGKFDMIFADPPYFLSNGGISCHAGKMVKVDKGNWDKSQGAEVNHEFNIAWLSRCQKLLNPNGTIWVSGTHHVIHSIGYAMQQLNMKVLNDITWEKPNPPPNLSCRYFTHSTETLIWAARNEKSRHLFNYKEMRRENNGKQMKTVWNMKPPAKEEKKFGKHPTQKPALLLERIMLASTKPDDWVFDPFAGSATTGVVSVLNGRKFVGCELEKKYITTSVKRLKAAMTES